MNRDLYALHDTDPRGQRRVDEEQAHILNSQGFGIFWTVNEFSGSRKKENLARLNSWYVEIDELDKSIQLGLIDASPVPPNLVIESKNGFHVYWNCREATVENYDSVMSGVRKFFLGDRRAKDVARLLRAPGYYHMKDPSDPFLVQVVWSFPGTYSERLMAYNFPAPLEDGPNTAEPRAVREMKVYGDDFWTKIYNLDCEQALIRLSGKRCVNGEVYAFRRVASGNLNVWVNGKPTSCFIDKNKRIGSSSKGGPTVWQWLRYYGHSNKEVYQIIKEEFPECL